MEHRCRQAASALLAFALCLCQRAAAQTVNPASYLAAQVRSPQQSFSAVIHRLVQSHQSGSGVLREPGCRAPWPHLRAINVH